MSRCSSFVCVNTSKIRNGITPSRPALKLVQKSKSYFAADAKWNLWHGKVDRALEIVDELAYALDVEGGSPAHHKLLKAVRAFEGYITANRAMIPNYGERYRQGKTITTAFVESAVNQVLNQTWGGTLSR